MTTRIPSPPSSIGQLPAQAFDGRAGHAETAAADVGLARHLRGEREDHARMPFRHVARRGGGGEEVGAHGVIDRLRERRPRVMAVSD